MALVPLAPVQPLALFSAIVDHATPRAARKCLAGAIPHAALGAPALENLSIEYVRADRASGLRQRDGPREFVLVAPVEGHGAFEHRFPPVWRQDQRPLGLHATTSSERHRHEDHVGHFRVDCDDVPQVRQKELVQHRRIADAMFRLHREQIDLPFPRQQQESTKNAAQFQRAIRLPIDRRGRDTPEMQWRLLAPHQRTDGHAGERVADDPSSRRRALANVGRRQEEGHLVADQLELLDHARRALVTHRQAHAHVDAVGRIKQLKAQALVTLGARPRSVNVGHRLHRKDLMLGKLVRTGRMGRKVLDARFPQSVENRKGVWKRSLPRSPVEADAVGVGRNVHWGAHQHGQLRAMEQAKAGLKVVCAQHVGAFVDLLLDFRRAVGRDGLGR